MLLYLLRHGEAEPYRAEDASRALMASGREAVAQQCRWLTPVDHFYCSPYLRARQTADIVQASVQRAFETLDLLTPEQAVSAMIDWLQQHLEGDICLVGHNPLLSQLGSALLGERHAVALPTAGLVCLESDYWMAGGAVLRFQR